MLEGDVTEEAVKDVEELLRAQQAVLTEAHKALAADIIQARKKAPATVQALNNLTPRLRSVQASLAKQLQAARQVLSRQRSQEEAKQQQDDAAEERRAAEQSDTKRIEQALPAALDAVTRAEDALEAVVQAAKPLSSELSLELTDAVKQALADTEAAAGEAQTALQAARKQISQQSASAKQYAPDARKVALAEYASLQGRLSEASQKLAPYLRARENFEQKAESKKVLSEVAGRLSAVETDVEKLVASVGGPDEAEEKIRAAEATLATNMKSVAAALKYVDAQINQASEPLKSDLQQMYDRGLQSKLKLEEFHVRIRGHSQQIQLQLMLRRGQEKTERAEELLAATVEADLPFAKGTLEAFPGPEASKAMEDCERAVKAAKAAASHVCLFLASHMKEVEGLPEASRAGVQGELEKLQERAESVSQRVATLRDEIAARAVAMQLHEATQRVSEVERAATATAAAAAPLLSDAALESADLGDLDAAVKATLEAEKAAGLAFANAKKALASKQRAPGGAAGGSSDAAAVAGCAEELDRLSARLSAAQLELHRLRKQALQGEKAVRGRRLLQDQEQAMVQLEKDVEKTEILTTPLGDERVTEQGAAEMVEAVDRCNQQLAAALKALEARAVSVLENLKDPVAKLMERAKRAQERINDMREVTRETQERALFEAMLSGGRERLARVQEALKRSTAAEAKCLGDFEALPVEEAFTAMKECEAAYSEGLAAITEARKFLTGRSLEMRRCRPEVAKHGLRQIADMSKKVDSAEKESASLVGKVKSSMDTLIAMKLAEVGSAIREALEAKGCSTSDLYDQLAGEGAEHVSEEAMSKYLDSLQKLSLSAEQKRLLFAHQQGGAADTSGPVALSRWAFHSMLQRFCKCVKEIAITNEFDIKTATTKRKLEAGEVIEIFEGPRTDVSLGVTRVRGRAVTDHVEGWVTVRGNQGTPFLQDTPKPYYCVTAAEGLPLHDALPSEGSNELASLMAHEVLEVLEGPKRETTGSLARGYGKAALDGATGWFTITSRSGQTCAAPGKGRYVCRSAIALTSGADIAKGDVLRKIDRGEILSGLDAPVEEGSSGLIRVQVRAEKDDVRGWVTLKGNGGTVYCEETGRAYVMSSSVPLQEGFESTSGTVRMLAENEVISLIEGPREDNSLPLLRARVRAASSGAIGWCTVTVGARGVRPWRPKYRCLSELALQSGPSASAEELRTLAPGEGLELLDGPRRETSVEGLRLKVRAAKDGAIGWVAASADNGKLHPALA
eukprot:TRINITY_DN12654_c0_g1_i1.p1 TRINITY_DN12654_c0_g1~~TRINITY_DN12654_c0_g1_i1.p1  ORF type:complete len:1473 (-),score=475.17 TRINITY_DN12654_c0_g1_i1:145-3909(-)